MGNKESVDSGNPHRAVLKPCPSFSAQRRIAHVDQSHRHGQSPAFDNRTALAAQMQFVGKNDNVDDEDLSEDELVARGSFYTSRSLPRNWSKASGISSSNFVNDKDNNRCDDVDGNDNGHDNVTREKPVARLSPTVKTYEKNGNSELMYEENGISELKYEKKGSSEFTYEKKGNSEFDIRKRENGNIQRESNHTRTRAADAKVKSNGSERNATSGINANLDKRSRNMQKDLQLVQSVCKWNSKSKGRLNVAVNRNRSDDNKNIRDTPLDKSVASPPQAWRSAERVECHSPSSGCQIGNRKNQWLGTLPQQGPLTAEVQSVQSGGFSLQCESENQSVEEDSDMFPSQSEQPYCFSFQRAEQNEFSESVEPDQGSSFTNNGQASCTSAHYDVCDSVSFSMANSTRVPVESEDSFVPNSYGFSRQCSLESRIPQSHTPEFGSTDIDFERFKDCFSFTTGKSTPDMPFGSRDPSMTSVGFNSQHCPYPHSQTLHNDTGQFEVRSQSLDTSPSSTFSTSTSEVGLSASMFKPHAEISEMKSPLLSDSFRMNSVNSVASQSGSFPFVKKQKNGNLGNEQNFEPTLPEQDVEITENSYQDMSNGTPKNADVVVKMTNGNSREQDAAVNLDVSSVSDRENSTGFAGSKSNTNTSKTHPTVFPTPAAKSSIPSTSPSSPLNKLHLNVSPEYVTIIPCNGLNNTGNRTTHISDAANFGGRNEENDKNNNNNNDERPYCLNTRVVMPRQHGPQGQHRMPPSRQPVESDADDHSAAASGAELSRGHGFLVPLEDPGGAASAFLQPVPDILSVSDRPGNPSFYAAYLLVADADIENFGLPFLLELESWGLSIFFRERDLILTGFEYENLSAIVEERCNGKVIVVVSNSYPQSPQCQYLTVFARNLDPDARKRNIIPIYIDKKIEDLPRVLTGLAIIRYNQVYRRGWLKDKIMGALSS